MDVKKLLQLFHPASLKKILQLFLHRDHLQTYILFHLIWIYFFKWLDIWAKEIKWELCSGKFLKRRPAFHAAWFMRLTNRSKTESNFSQLELICNAILLWLLSLYAWHFAVLVIHPQIQKNSLSITFKYHNIYNKYNTWILWYDCWTWCWT